MVTDGDDTRTLGRKDGAARALAPTLTLAGAGGMHVSVARSADPTTPSALPESLVFPAVRATSVGHQPVENLASKNPPATTAPMEFGYPPRTPIPVEHTASATAPGWDGHQSVALASTSTNVPPTSISLVAVDAEKDPRAPLEDDLIPFDPIRMMQHALISQGHNTRNMKKKAILVVLIILAGLQNPLFNEMYNVGYFIWRLWLPQVPGNMGCFPFCTR